MDKSDLKRPNIEKETPDNFSDNESYQCKLDVEENPDDSDLNFKIDIKSRKGSSKTMNSKKKFSDDNLSKKDSKIFNKH